MDSKPKEEKNLTAVKELVHIAAAARQWRYWRFSRKDAERILQTLEKGLNGGFIFQFKDIVDKEEKEEQKKLCQLWEECCRELGFDIEKTHDQGRAWVARPRLGHGLSEFLSLWQIYMKVLDAYEFAAGSPDKALLLRKCVEEVKDTLPSHEEWETHLLSSEKKMQKVLQAQSLSTLQNFSQFLAADIDAFVTSSASRYIVWYDDGPHHLASQSARRLTIQGFQGALG